ncbi:MAG: alpha/beta hydrolase family protein [Candidatus Dormibacterales bacterium]
MSAETAAAPQDARVAAATAHWRARFVNNGVDLDTFDATVARIRTWDRWCAEWAESGRRFEEIAEAAEAEGRRVTAGQAWLRAAFCHHFGKFVFMDDLAQQRAAHDRTVACFGKGMWALEPPAERVEIPYRDGVRLAGLLRRPPGPARPPVVVMVPGLDSVKEELQPVADVLLRRGLATLAVDGPGQGEAEYELAIEPAYERPVAAIVDWLRSRTHLDHSRVGLFGVSLGGYYAVRAAAREPRLKAAVGLAGPYDLGSVWDPLPEVTKAAFRHRSRSQDERQAKERASELTLAGIERTVCPTLLVHGRLDRIIPHSEAERAARIAGVELATYEEGNHGVTNLAFESRAMMADWLARRLA